MGIPAAQGIPSQITTLSDLYAFMRTGTVLGEIDPFAATVDVGGTAIRAAYIRQSPPEIGDVVAVLRQGASWLILGTTTYSGDNLVQNPSFEDLDPDTSVPLWWARYNITNTSAWSSVISPDAVEGSSVLEVVPSSALTGTSYVYGAPIGVVPGQVWELSAYANGFYPAGNTDTSDASLYALWFANSTDLYPTTSDADSLIQARTNLTQEDLMVLLSGTVTVPGAAAFMRPALRSVVAQGAGLHWDFVTARLAP